MKPLNVTFAVPDPEEVSNVFNNVNFTLFKFVTVNKLLESGEGLVQIKFSCLTQRTVTFSYLKVLFFLLFQCFVAETNNL